jgi:hypothetical protein
MMESGEILESDFQGFSSALNEKNSTLKKMEF